VPGERETRAMVLEQPGPVASAPLVERVVALQEPAPDEIVVRVGACAVCRTDLQIVEGDVVAPALPVVPGHQIVGRVEAVGAAVDGLAVGDRVGVGWLAGTCGTCVYCRSGQENLCEQARFTGRDRAGGYAEHAVVDARFAFPLPEALSDVAAAPLLCGGVIGYRSLARSRVEPGGRLGLYGFGASALLTLQVALHRGMEVHVCTRSEAEQRRALALGAASAGGYDRPPPVALDGAITFAPAGAVVVEALRAVRRGGTVAINAIHLDEVPAFPYELLWWERSLASVANYTRDDARAFLALAAEAQLRTTVEEHPLADANVALGRLARGEVAGAAVLHP
jgi:propanol-preferring alcohol dehydrogenase